MAGPCEGVLIAVALPGWWCCRVAVAWLVALRAVAKGAAWVWRSRRSRVTAALLVAFVLSPRGGWFWRSRRLA